MRLVLPSKLSLLQILLLHRDKLSACITVLILPLAIMRLQRVFETKLKAVFIGGPVGWLSRRPEHVLPRGAFLHLQTPSSLMSLPPIQALTRLEPRFLLAKRSKTNSLVALFLTVARWPASLRQKSSPAVQFFLIIVAPEVAMTSVRLPAIRAGFDAFVLAAG